MAENNSTQEREPHESDVSYGESNEGSYDDYRKESSEGYTAYKEAGRIEEAVYDLYESDYEDSETPDQGAKISSCTRIGRLSNLSNV